MAPQTLEKPQLASKTTELLAPLSGVAKIATREQYTEIVAIRRHIDTLRAEIKDAFATQKDYAWKAHKAICAAEAKYDDPLKAGRERTNRLLADWDVEQDRLRQAEARRLEEEARKKAAEERAAEAKRLWAEGQRKAAQAVKAEPLVVAPPVLPPAPKTEGLTYVTKWRFRIVNSSLVPIEYRTIDEGKIQKIVDAMKGETNIPGVQPYEDRIVRASR